MTTTSTTVRSARRQFTLAELLVVLLILAATAGMAVVLVGEGKKEQAESTSVNVSLSILREAILGSPAQPGFKSDLSRFPSNLRELWDGTGLDPWDPVSKTGWRGPYVIPNGGLDAGDTEGLQDLQNNGFSTHVTAGDRFTLDPYGRPFVILSASGPVRLASAGPDRILGNADDATLDLE